MNIDNLRSRMLFLQWRIKTFANTIITSEQFKEKRLQFYGLKEKTDKEYICFEEDSSFLISAPHTIQYTRENGTLKPGEPNTISYALTLNELNKCSIILKSKPTWQHTEFKNKISQLIKTKRLGFLFDIHGLSARREEILNVGTAHGALLQTDAKKRRFNMFTEIMSDNNIPCSIDVPFAASGKNCVANIFGQDPDLFALQLEINSRIAEPNHEEQLNSFINGMSTFINYTNSLNRE